MMLAHKRTSRRAHRLPAVWRGMLWMVVSGIVFSFLNAVLRSLSMNLDVYQTQFLRYSMGIVAMMPFLFSEGWRAYIPKDIKGQFWRGSVHTLALIVWFTALPHVTMADLTAIGFTGPIFIMIGAVWFLGEKMRLDRWVAALVGFAGVVVVVAPHLQGGGGLYTLLMLASAPMFAVSFLIIKTLTHLERTSVIVLWQSIAIALFSLPLGLLNWSNPSLYQWLGFLLSGILGSTGHYMLTRGIRATDVSATQSSRFLDLIWASLVGWLVFSDIPSQTTVLGAIVILCSTIWIARRERTTAQSIV
ncbi:MAG: DMT family transporter [Limnohabitans sp.]|nr:DMT family transporter [Limnohabitans sp.]